MKVLGISPIANGEQTAITIELSKEDTATFLHALKTGAFAELGIVGAIAGELPAEGSKEWSERMVIANSSSKPSHSK